MIKYSYSNTQGIINKFVIAFAFIAARLTALYPARAGTQME